MELVYIEWHDAFGDSQWKNQEEMEELANSKEVIVRQVGWIFKETKKEIILYARYSPKDYHGGLQFGNIEKIPKTWIKKRISFGKKLGAKVE